jgi:hypothetical protein
VVVASIVVGPIEGQVTLEDVCTFMDSFIHLKSGNLGTMVSIMSILTTKSTREVRPEIVVVVLPLEFVIIVPLGVLVSLILVAPKGMILLGIIFSWSWVIIVSVFPFLLGIIRLMCRIFRIQMFKSMKLLNGRGLNKVNIGMWLSMWRRN